MLTGTRNDGLRLLTMANIAPLPPGPFLFPPGYIPYWPGFGITPGSATQSECVSMRWAGAMPGVVVTAVSARNGIGTGTLVASSGGLAWQAPGSELPGTPSEITGDGNYLLEDGTDPSAFVRVAVYADYLPASGGGSVAITDSYGPAALLAGGDLSAADAAGGLVSITQYSLTNVTPNAVINVKLWLDPTASGEANLTVSSDGINYFAPVSSTDAHVLAWPIINAGGSQTLWIKRTIAASGAANPKVLNEIQYSWQGS
jgi:hypothetical protein